MHKICLRDPRKYGIGKRQRTTCGLEIQYGLGYNAVGSPFYLVGHDSLADCLLMRGCYCGGCCCPLTMMPGAGCGATLADVAVAAVAVAVAVNFC
jgi:hypothetical protein